MSKNPNRKKSYVDPQVQGALVKRLTCHWIGFFAVAAVIAFSLQVLANPFRPMSQHLQQLWWTQGPFLLVMVFLLPVFIVDTIRLSNRFAGPIYRLRQTIRGLAEGEPVRPLRFRDFDFWHGLAEDFNHMVDRLSNSEAETEDEEIDEHATVKPVGSLEQ